MLRGLLTLVLVMILLCSCVVVPEAGPATPQAAPVPQDADTPSAAPEPWATWASDRYGVAVQYPGHWVDIDAYGGSRRGAEDGFVQLGAVGGGVVGLDAVVTDAVQHKLTPYGTEPTVQELRVAGQDARLVLPSDDQPEGMAGEAVMFVAYPEPVTIDGSAYEYLSLYAAVDHIRDIADSLVFLSVSSERARVEVAGVVAGVSPSARTIDLESEVDGVAVLALTEDARIVGMDGTPLALADLTVGSQVKARGCHRWEPGESERVPWGEPGAPGRGCTCHRTSVARSSGRR